AWFEQGWTYTGLYFAKYWIAGVGAVAAFALLMARWGRRRAPGPGDDPWQAETTLALMLAAVQTLFVVKVGGDFMYARFLIPATPFYLIATELVLWRWVSRRRDAA